MKHQIRTERRRSGCLCHHDFPCLVLCFAAALGSLRQLPPANAGDVVSLSSTFLGDGLFEYRITWHAQPYLERSGLSNFTLPFPGFATVVQEPGNWRRAATFPSGPQPDSSLQWLHDDADGDAGPCVFRVRSQKPAFRTGTAQCLSVLHWNDWAQPIAYATQVQERLTLNCVVPCEIAEADGSAAECQASGSAFPELEISQVSIDSSHTVRLGIAARTGLPLCIEGALDLGTWNRVGFLAGSGTGTFWSATTAEAHRFYRVGVSKPELAHPEALASTQWLEQHLADPMVRIVDARFPQSDADFKAGHIPGAVKVDPLVDLLDTNSAPAYLAPTVAQFEALMGRLGVSNSTTVVTYDLDGGLWCARLWWALRYYGHDQVKLLHGGLPKWRAELRPLEKTITIPPAATFHAEAHPEWRAEFADVQAAVGASNLVILDCLSAAQHNGQAADMPGLPIGHIPTAKNVPAPSSLDVNKLLRTPPEVLEAVYQQIGVTPDQQIITYCGGGYYGAFSLFVLHELGYEQVRLYDGSWADWIARKGAIETGP